GSPPPTRSSTPTATSAPVTCRSSCCSTSAATSTTGTPLSSMRSPRTGVITLDNAGVAATSGTTPSTIEAIAHDTTAFIDPLALERFDLLGFSIGSFVALEIALIRPDLLRRRADLRQAADGPRPADDLADAAGAVRRGVRMGHPQPHHDEFAAD